MTLYEQYQKIKAQHPNAVVVMQIGDFFEAFGEDAQILSDHASQIVLTRNFNGQDVKMAGMPVHMADKYFAMLIKAGFRLAIARKELSTLAGW